MIVLAAFSLIKDKVHFPYSKQEHEMANPDFSGSLTYSGSETFIIPPSDHFYYPSSGGGDEVTYHPSLSNPAANLYTITVTDPNTGSVTIHEAGLDPTSPGTTYFGAFTGFTTGGDYSVITTSMTGPDGATVADSKYWLFLHEAPPADLTSATIFLGSLSYYAGPFVPPCYAEGSRILTIHGEIDVEFLRPGDVVITHAGLTSPVVWIGRRHVDPARMEKPDDYCPIRIGAHAFGMGRPHRDLRVSPDHAIAVDGLLIPARNLLNGATIVRDAAEPVTYYHVELGEHALLMAEGLAAESYLDTGNRGSFVNGGPATRLHPDFARRMWNERSCAPIADSGPPVDAARRQLIAIAKAQGFAMTTDPAAVLLVDGVPIEALENDSDTLTFEVPAGTPQTVRLVTRSCAPAWTDGTADFRQLGIAISMIELCNLDCHLIVSSGSDILSNGFNEVETDGDETWRWTSGDTLFPTSLFAPFYKGCKFILRLRGGIAYWLRGETEIVTLADSSYPYVRNF